MSKSLKLYLGLVAFLFTTQIVFDLLYAENRITLQTYSSDTFYASALIDFIVALIAFLFIIKGDKK